MLGDGPIDKLRIKYNKIKIEILMEDNMISVRLPKEMEEKLEEISKLTNTSKSYNIRKAIRLYLSEVEGYYIALKRLKKKDSKYYTTEELKK
jgi:RHH-type rel operon transcriptional repressor/antitoxin RelB